MQEVQEKRLTGQEIKEQIDKHKDHIRLTILNALQEFRSYKTQELDYDQKSKHKSNLQKYFDSLKKINTMFLNEIKNLNKEETEQEYIKNIFDHFKIKRRLKFSAFFWISFYYLGTIYVSRSLNFPPIRRNLFLSFFIFPNLYYYYKKFQTINGHIEEILLRHNINKFVIIKDKEMLENFVTDYLYFNKKNKIL